MSPVCGGHPILNNKVKRGRKQGDETIERARQRRHEKKHYPPICERNRRKEKKKPRFVNGDVCLRAMRHRTEKSSRGGGGGGQNLKGTVTGQKKRTRKSI